MQNVNFKNIDEFLAYIPEEELMIVEYLRNIIFDCIPGCEERLTYNVPYYRKNYSICFIWPASVTWGNKITYPGVRLGFANGNLLTDETHYLDRGSRKQIYWKAFTSIKEIKVNLIKSFVFESVLIDEEKAKVHRHAKKWWI